MSAFFAALIESVVKFAILAALAVAGVILGKKYKDKRNKQ